ncbi:hypothetical protein SS1G_04587 [Sclerotinia sclerotiorum 1980 UF-70]|uniref:FAD dependent oxidoreductase domain-containing protein n=1 Tax=Sclerotinia sclerotiorum (strain ATCC 18683 / 1980 / Ss-1) TaxID=665079 RepID=A7EGZ5_SCLS1|nr:hypothetical protein SS1G_04587 [Sclerotinia sclerotiorum 1980 UF-70]EDO02111.1 hypothetical protein SS1G_04587 [Sclerotinia sclerotiorum 1980 UF-70]
MSFIVTQFSSPYIPLAARQEALDRAFADPGIPDAIHTTKSFWMKEPHPEVASVQSEHLPEIANYVIIGSGITGASVAQALLEGLEEASPSETQSLPQPKVIMLEARDSCSGATGRNGGHILETGEEYAMLKERLGKDEAIKIHKLRISHLEALIKSADHLGLTEESQVRKVRFLRWGFIEADELAKEFGIPNAAGAVTGIAGAMWPYKFVTGLLAHLRKQFPSNFLLETNTSVSQIHRGEHYLEVTTPRGTIKSKHVIHCTNSHIGHLVPGIKGCIFSIVGQMSAQPPGDKFKHQSDHSWIFNYAHGFDYLTQLPISASSNGEMMMGGGYAQTQNGGIHEAGISKDSELNMYANIHLRGVLGAVFAPENWGALHVPPVKSMWTGNMGFSTDGLPWVGALPSSVTDRKITTTRSSYEGAEWAAAAFSGEGMVHAWLCGKALAEMILTFDVGREGVVIPEWFPQAMVISEERLAKARLERYAKDCVVV